MRTRLLTAPAWALGLAYGGAFSLLYTAWGRFGQGRSWGEAVAVAVVCGALFGLVIGPVQRAQNQRTAAAVGSRSGVDLGRVVRAASRGPVPADPKERRAARVVAAAQLAALDRQLPYAVVVAAVLLGISAWLVVTDSPHWWLGAVFCAVVLLPRAVIGRRLRRRIERLDAG